MRKLASIQKINLVELIPGANAIEKLGVLGWEIVAKKGDFKVGDLCVFIEIDSILPDRPEFEFMRSYNFKIKTVQMRGQISQGIAFPLSIITDAHSGYNLSKLKEDDVVTELLDIVKWDPDNESLEAERIPTFNDKNRVLGLYKKYKYFATRRIKKFFKIPTDSAKGIFPSYVPKTDETRCISAETVIVTEDGTKTIKEICDTKYSGKVLSYNEEKNVREFKKIIGHNISSNNNDWYEIKLSNGKKMIVTSNHGIYMPEIMAYRSVKDLVSGNKIFVQKTD